MIYLYYILAALLIYMSYKSFRGGVAYLKYFEQELNRPSSLYMPFATIIVPCKGFDPGLEENLAALFEQDYPGYEVIFVVDSKNDPACAAIETVLRKAESAGVISTIVVAPRSTWSSQKVENLRQAVLHASDSSEIFVFVDSDTRPSREWLKCLTTPLEDRSIGASTGYRWFIAEHVTLGSELRSIWNASIASALGPNLKSNFCWGGSMAIRRQTFESLNIREKWKGTLSDDFALTKAVRAAGMGIYFVPKALTASIGDSSLVETLEFTNRQMKITRVYASDLWLLSYFGSFVFNLVIISSLLIILFSRQNDFNVFVSTFTLAAVSLFSAGKSWLRLRAVKLVFAGQWPAVDDQWFTQITLWLVSPLLFLINCITATFSRRMTWRGIRYELKSPTETVIITD